MRQVQDHYFRKAKAEGYLARSAYKLIEIDDRKQLLRRGDCVLDCGCAPGSWLQVAAARVGSTGRVVGVDLEPVKHRFSESHVVTLTGDFTAMPPADVLAAAGDATRKFDVIVSDMAPKTSGDHHGDHHRSVRLCRAVLDRCHELLRPGGRLAMKVFEGQAFAELLADVRRRFETAKAFKPRASRSESSETYIVAHDFRGSPQEPRRPEQQAAARGGAPRHRSTGWSR